MDPLDEALVEMVDRPPTETLTTASLDSAFQGGLGSSRLSSAYRVGLFLGAIVTIMLPMIYFALTLLVAYGAWQWLLYARPLLGQGFYPVLGYLIIFAACAFLVLFMFKPFFARSGDRPVEFELDEERYPLLAHFISLICAAVRAPAPRKVTIDCNVNASASLRRGLLSFFGHDLSLTIGAPLMAGMTTRQLAGVLAHEFGHFSQGSAMRLSYLVRSINLWFARVVFQRDDWDEALAAGGSWWPIELFKGLCRVMVWITRKILWGLMMVSHAIGMYLLRAMEYDADSYEARLAGSSVFASTSQSIRILSAGHERAVQISNLTVSEGNLCDDFPSLVEAMADRFPEDIRQKILETELPRSRFDTHPPDEERVAAAQAMAAPGIFQMELPARRLIPDFDDFARQVTRIFYLNGAAVDPGKISLVPLQDYLHLVDEELEYENDASEYLEDVTSLQYPVLQDVERREPFANLEEGLAAIRSTRRSIREQSEQFREQKQTAQEKMQAASGDQKTLEKLFKAQEVVLQRLARLVGEQIVNVEALLRTADVETLFSSSTECDEHRQRLAECLDVIDGITREKELKPLMNAVNGGWFVVEQLGSTRDDRLAQELVDCVEKVRTILPRLQSSFREVQYPLTENSRVATLRDYVCDGLPAFSDELLEDLSCGSHVMKRLSVCYARCLGRVAHVVRLVETAMPEA